jgi:hypothetical protein
MKAFKIIALISVLISGVFLLPSFKPGSPATDIRLAEDTSTIPRFATAAGDDNTGRIMTWRYFTPTDAAGADTAKLYPRAYTTIIKYTAVDSLAFSISNTSQSYIGDELTFIVTNSSGSGHQVKFVGTGWQVGSGGAAIALTASKRANINFVYDGIYWVETSRLAQ